MNEPIEICGLQCLRDDTSALEAWLMMHSLRRVICGCDELPSRRGTFAHFATVPLQPKEIAFIEQMARDSGFPPVEVFRLQHGLVGVTDYEVVESTVLPGWDGTPYPVVLSNPRWFRDGILVPVPPDICLDDGDQPAPSRRERRLRRHRR